MEEQATYKKADDLTKWDDRHPEETGVAVLGGMAVIQMAMQKNYSPELIEKMMALQERFEANEARKAYHKAMSAFKANPPKIWRDLQVKYTPQGKPPTEWSHSDLGTAADAISSALGEHGLNSSWRTEQQDNGEIKVTCLVTHELGHSESTWLKSPPDASGGKNAIQAIGSTVFYLERYTLFAITGLAPARKDDDGKASTGEPEFITEKQVSEITDMMNDIGLKEVSLTNLFGCKLIEYIPAGRYQEAITALKDAKKRKEAKVKHDSA